MSVSILPRTRLSRHSRAFAAVLSLIAAAAVAGPSSDSASTSMTANGEATHVVLHYDRQSVQTSAGAQVMYRRILQAAEQVCPAGPGEQHILSAATRACRAQAIARAVQSIDSPRLVALHEASSKHI